MKNKFTNLFIYLLLYSLIFAQNQPELIFQQELIDEDWDQIYINDIAAGSDVNEFYVSFESVNHHPDSKMTVSLHKYSGQNRTLQWKIDDPTEFQHTSPIWGSIFYSEADNSIRWITDKNSFDVENPQRFNLFKVDADNGETQFLADLDYRSKYGIWYDKFVTTKDSIESFELVSARINVIDNSGELLSSFEYAPARYLTSTQIAVKGDAAYLLCDNPAAQSDTSLPSNLFVKYDLISNSILWEAEVYDNLYEAYLDFDIEGNILIAARKRFEDSIIIMKYNNNGGLIWKKNTNKELSISDLLVIDEMNISVIIGWGYDDNSENTNSNGYLYGFNTENGNKLFDMEYNFGVSNDFSINIKNGAVTKGNRIALVAWVYNHETGTEFKAYNYLSVFDLSSVTSINNEIKNYDFNLSQNYPNPFNPSTTISYSIPKQTHVSLKVYDVLGKEVAELVNEEMSTGSYKVDFDAANLSSGIYFYTLRANEYYSSRKMLLIK